MYTRICPGCGYQGGIYDFSPSIEIENGDFRIFHFYNEMKGPLYCNQCKRKHLLKIAHYKNITKSQINFLEKKIKEEEEKFSKNLIN
ncbi:hypothetical protein LDC_1915 [sediment metagenome]|uniref:Uncharacterized protein n=1 Tax=sediment metagenome TaxID=749907 RepID=D9PK50_9ZZZZ